MPTLSLGALFLNKARHWQVHLFPDHANEGHQHNCIDAHGDLLRGLQVAESAIAATTTLLADKLEGPYVLFADCVDNRINSVSKDMDTYVRKLPLGVCASIAPFNFPACAWLLLALACCSRTFKYDTSLDNSHGRSHRQYPHLQAFRT